MKLTQLTITPDIAVRLLSHNHGNRKLRKSHLSHWCDVLASGGAVPTHQGIAIEGTIDNPIRLLDGQHRLAAIVQTGISLATILAEDVPAASFENIDGGLARNLFDRTGIPKPLLGSASKIYYMTIGSTVKPSARLMQEIASIIEPHDRHITNTTRKGLTTAGFRCAFTAQQKLQGFNYSTPFVHGDFDILPPAFHVLYRRQCINPIGGASGRGTGSTAQFYACLRAIENPELRTISIPADVTARARKDVARVFPEAVELIHSYRSATNA
jgi:hypothetical protein